MDKFDHVEWSILEGYYLVECQKIDALELLPIFKLKESDEMIKLRELVYHVEQLVEKGYLETNETFYEASDKMSFDYMNSAVSVQLNHIKITELGRSLVADYYEKNAQTVLFKGLQGLRKLFGFTVWQWLLILIFGVLCFWGGMLWSGYF